MLRLLAVAAGVLLLPSATCPHAVAQEALKSYPITLAADDVHQFEELKTELNGLTLSGKDLVVVPIRCEAGVTGAMVLGKGGFRFKPEQGKVIEGEFRGAMLRFSPDDQAKLLPLEKAKVTTDHAAHEMSRHLLDNVFGHCYHRGNEALIPKAGAFVANVYSRDHGDLLISTTPEETVVYNFTKKQRLFSGK